MNTTIKLIDVFGQFENQGTDHYYTYLSTTAPSGWRNVMKDPRNEVTANLRQCYVTWCTATDWWIAKMIRNPHDSRGGFAMLSVCLGPNRPTDGEKAITLLDNFAQFFIVEKNWNDADAEKALMNQEQDFAVVPCATKRFVEPSVSNNSAYRNYGSRQELAQFLSFLPQSGYEKYSRIFFVPREESTGMPVECLDTKLPMKKMYIIDYPADCTSPSGKNEIMEDEDLAVVFSKECVQPVEKVIRGGQNSNYAYIEGNYLHIRSGAQIGLVHERAIEVRCQDKEGREINGFRLNNVGRQDLVRIDDHRVLVSENYSNTIILEVIPTGDRYDKRQIEIDLTKDKGNVKTFVLNSREYKVVFRLGNEDFVAAESMSPSVVRTKWGAYDCVVSNTDRTIYFRVHGKPAEKAGQDAIHTVTEDLPFSERVKQFFEENWKTLLIVLLLLLLGYGIYACVSLFAYEKTPWPFGAKTETIVTPPVTPPQDVKPANNDTVVDSVAISNRKHDIEYLKEHDVWKADDLKTEEFKSLCEAMTKGDVEKVIKLNDSLFVGDDVKNGFFKQIVENLKEFQQANDSDEKLLMASKKMIQICSNSIDLNRLASNMKLVKNK